MLALIDADTPVFSTALVSEDINLALAKHRLDINILGIIKGSGADDARLFVSGEGNFRKEIDATYKANRTNKPSPKWREALSKHLVDLWGAVECHGYEADDGCGIHQRYDGSTIICGIDKDLLQIPGLHYQWPIVKKGKTVRQALYHDIDVETGWRNLFTQALVGDTSDNIKGVPGIGKEKAAKILEWYETREDMHEAVLVEYVSVGKDWQERFWTTMDLLYVWREIGVTYSIRDEIYGDGKE